MSDIFQPFTVTFNSVFIIFTSLHTHTPICIHICKIYCIIISFQVGYIFIFFYIYISLFIYYYYLRIGNRLHRQTCPQTETLLSQNHRQRVIKPSSSLSQNSRISNHSAVKFPDLIGQEGFIIFSRPAAVMIAPAERQGQVKY